MCVTNATVQQNSHTYQCETFRRDQQSLTLVRAQTNAKNTTDKTHAVLV